MKNLSYIGAAVFLFGIFIVRGQEISTLNNTNDLQTVTGQNPPNNFGYEFDLNNGDFGYGPNYRPENYNKADPLPSPIPWVTVNGPAITPLPTNITPLLSSIVNATLASVASIQIISEDETSTPITSSTSSRRSRTRTTRSSSLSTSSTIIETSTSSAIIETSTSSESPSEKQTRTLTITRTNISLETQTFVE
ncbi:hypothetical protein AYI70_g10922 [Smittium culicis]|uniref:Uncharacterized protein n=1 Tax=Smittium culicis TaxID=133412 RepID=A0A1R1X481_9FUNG|nr:hypothetical protein AYI70_g10922 [Smittium culicis]